MKCDICGTTEGRVIKSKKYEKNLCMKCYEIAQYQGDIELHDLPKAGELSYDNKGNPICHVCGRATKKLMSHAWQKHKISAYDYKKEFGLNTTHGVMCESSTELARERNLENFDIVVKQNLEEAGVATRFTKDSNGRPKEKLSLQELNRIQAMNRKRKARKEDTQNV